MSGHSETDVLVVGSGVAGLSAAIEAAEARHRVLIVDAEATHGGASIISGGASCFADTALQRASGIEDSVELALADWSEMGGPTADLEWARQYLERATEEVYVWCEELGVSWYAVMLREGNTVARWHLPRDGGASVVRAMYGRARELGVEVMLNFRVDELSFAADAVSGAKGFGPDGGVEINATSVVFCSGGFAGSLEMVLEHAPHLRSAGRVLTGSGPTAIGLGHGVLAAAGAQLVHMDHVWVYPNGTPDPMDANQTRGVAPRGITNELWLNLNGERFHNETMNGGFSGTKALLAQPGQTAWCVFAAWEADNVLLVGNHDYGSPAGLKPEAIKEFWRGSGFVRRASNPDGLADAMGLPSEAVGASIAELNDAIQQGLETDPRFGKDLRGLKPIEGELMAMQFFPQSQKNLGGVRTDLTCAVLDQAGAPIAGLYAAGEVAGMAGGCINGRAALEGTMFGPCIFAGRIAGQQAAARCSEVAVPG